MPVIWCSISAHGFGHAAQVVPVLNELGRRIPNLRALLRTEVPASFFQPRLTIPWDLRPAQQDIGCIQDGPLTIDVAATWAAHRTYLADWSGKVTTEAREITAAKPNLVLSDISPLGVAAGSAAGIPTVGMCSLSWDVVLEALRGGSVADQAALIDMIRAAYGRAERFLRVAPAVTITGFRTCTDIGPIAEPAAPERERLRLALGARDSDRIILVGFGGVPLKHLPFAEMERIPRMRFVLDGAVPDGLSRTHSMSTTALPFKSVLASADLILTKPGYGTFVEAVALGTPVVYVRRFNFADEESLISYLHRYGRGAELSRKEFAEGRWESVIDRLLRTARPATLPPALSGPRDAAAILEKYF